MNRILSNNITVLAWRKLYKWYDSTEQRVDFVYRSSQSFKLIKALQEGVKTCVAYSFLGRISEIGEPNTAFLNNSRIVQYLINFYKRWKDSIVRYSETSLAVCTAKNAKEGLSVSTIKKVSLIVIVVILVNAILLVFLQKPINLFSFLIRILLLFVATAGVSCEADWLTIARDSRFLSKMELD